MSKLEKRMYFFTMYNLSEIQKGIQCGHCVEEYSDLYSNDIEYKEYREDKAWIILNGGTSNNMGKTFYNDDEYIGSMEGIVDYLEEHNIKYAKFNEPDLNNATSAICFICDERVFNKKDYPDFRTWYLDIFNSNISFDNKQKFLKTDVDNYTSLYKKPYNIWLELIGGQENLLKRDLLKDKRLA